MEKLTNFFFIFIFLQFVLFGEIVMAQKVMYEKFGNDFLINFVSKGFLAAHCPQDLAEEYCQKVQVNIYFIFIFVSFLNSFCNQFFF